MAIFRKININFWEDTKVVDEMTPEDRYFMLYLMTNPHTNQCGCYSITYRQIEFETGYNKDTIIKLINRFCNILKIIKYSEETKELLILNWSKYNWTNSPKIMTCILKEAKSIKNKEFRYCINRVLIQYGYSIDTETQQEQEQEQEQEKEQEKEKEKTENLKFFIKEYEKVFYRPPLIDENMKKKINEILENNPQIKIKLSELLKKLKETEFELPNKKKYKPNLTWLLKDSNFIKFANDELVKIKDTKQDIEEERQRELKKLAEMEKRILGKVE